MSVLPNSIRQLNYEQSTGSVFPNISVESSVLPASVSEPNYELSALSVFPNVPDYDLSVLPVSVSELNFGLSVKSKETVDGCMLMFPVPTLRATDSLPVSSASDSLVSSFPLWGNHALVVSSSAYSTVVVFKYTLVLCPVCSNMVVFCPAQVVF